jgi:hypothetical protein
MAGCAAFIRHSKIAHNPGTLRGTMSFQIVRFSDVAINGVLTTHPA